MTAPKTREGRRVDSEQFDEALALGRYNEGAITPAKGEVAELQLDSGGNLKIALPLVDIVTVNRGGTTYRALVVDTELTLNTDNITIDNINIAKNPAGQEVFLQTDSLSRLLTQPSGWTQIVDYQGRRATLNQDEQLRVHSSGSAVLFDKRGHEAFISPNNYLHTKTIGTPLLTERFPHGKFDTSVKWQETSSSGAVRSITNSTIKLETSTQLGSEIREDSRQGFTSHPGSSNTFRAVVKLGPWTETNNERMWGVMSEDHQQEYLFYKIGSELTATIALNGVDVRTPIAGIDDTKYHLYEIQYFGNNRVLFHIDDVEVHSATVRNQGNLLIGETHLHSHIHNHNVGSVSSGTVIECSAISIFDDSGGGTQLFGQDASGVIRPVNVNTQGTLLVEASGTVNTIWTTLAQNRQAYATSTNLNAVAGTSEVAYFLIKNPAASNKTLLIKKNNIRNSHHRGRYC